MFSYIFGGDSITVFLDGNSYAVNKQAKTYNMLVDAIRANNIDAVRQAVDVRSKILQEFQKVSSMVTVADGKIMYGDREVTGLVSSRVFEMLRLNLDVAPMIRFIERLMQNPSRRAVNELFGFMDACSLPITEDGYFLAYKRVCGDYTSVHDQKTDNSIGRVVEMPRNAVDEDSERTCSYGLHFCSYDYLKHFSGERIVVLKIDPADVVAIPKDYNNSKGRACRYLVVDEIPLNEYHLPETILPEFYTDETYDDEDEDTTDYSVLGTTHVSVDDTMPLRPGSDMTLQKLRDIRKCLREGQTYASIAREFDISTRQVGRIDRGEAWADVT